MLLLPLTPAQLGAAERDDMESPDLTLAAGAYADAVACFASLITHSTGAPLPCLGRMRLTATREDADVVRVEGRGAERRHGTFLLRVDGAPLVLLAPHAVSDLRTGEVARILFDSAGARALLLGTVHRYGPTGSKSKGERRRPGFDLAHLPLTCFQAFVEALARRTQPTPLFVEVHGFDADSPAAKGKARSADLIVSTGARIASEDEAPPSARALIALLGTERAALYGVSTATLGGTGNAQARLLETIAPDRFLHLEMSSALRERLLADAALGRELARALMAPSRP